MTDDSVPIQSKIGKQLLAHAMAEEYCVLEFRDTEDGDLLVADITEHLQQLEKMYVNDDSERPIELRTEDNA